MLKFFSDFQVWASAYGLVEWDMIWECMGLGCER
jgi:hypothetical protein